MPLPSNANDVFSARGAAAITKHDSTNFSPCRAIYVGGAGDVVVVFAENGEAVTFVGVPAGTVLPVAAKRVNSTNTTATSMVALY